MQDNTLKLGGVLTVFVLIILGVVLAGSLADNLYFVTNQKDIHNETLNITSARYSTTSVLFRSINESLNFTLDNTNWDVITQMRNSSSSALTETTDYVIDTSVVDHYQLRLKNSTRLYNTTNSTYVQYKYPTSDYVQNAAARVLVNLLIVLFIIGFVVFIAYWAVKKYEEWS